MPGKVRKCLRDKTIRNVLMSSLSETDKNCILDVFIRYEQMLDRDVVEIGACEGCKNIVFRYPYASMHPCVSCIRAHKNDYYSAEEGAE